MKTILTAWAIALLVYLVTPYAIADDQSTKHEETIWTGYNVVGEVCVAVRDKASGEPATSRLRLVNDGKWSKAIDVKGLSCLDVAFAPKSELRKVAGSNNVEVDVVDDFTTPFITIELPI